VPVDLQAMLEKAELSTCLGSLAQIPQGQPHSGGGGMTEI
jgi:hypothetical protein